MASFIGEGVTHKYVLDADFRPLHRGITNFDGTLNAKQMRMALKEEGVPYLDGTCSAK